MNNGASFESRINARVTPDGAMDVLSQLEVTELCKASQGDIYELFRCCVLAVLNTGSHTDDSKRIMEEFKDFDVSVIQQERGIKLEITDAPANAFVDGKMIDGIRENIFAVLRDIVYVHNEIEIASRLGEKPAEHTTNAIFDILRNAKILKTHWEPNLVVCWGGHSISRGEYEYTKEVGHQLGLRGMDICTGCGPGAMKGPMKGATIGHAKQRIYDGRYIGITEPGIIAAESPNPIVNDLVIMPDIEKRLESFVRLAHGILAFPGGAGTAEEILYILGILLHPDNQEMPFPLILTGPKSAADYFETIHEFIGGTIGFSAQQKYKIIIDDPILVAREIARGIDEVRAFRREHSDAYYFNWLLKVARDFQEPFEPSHENMASLSLSRNQKPHDLASNLRRAFSGIVAGNVKADGIQSIEEYGPFEIRGDREIMEPLDALLNSFVAQNRMKLEGSTYAPCYRIIR